MASKAGHISPTHQAIAREEQHAVHNYNPLPVVITRAEGVWVEDVEGRRYIDMLSAYSALNHGHRHPRIIAALKAQADRLTLTSRAFRNDQIAPFLERVSAITGKSRVLPMNSGAEAVETAVKAARRWAYDVKGVPPDQAEIIVCENNFHGRTITAVSMSSEPAYRRGFGPFTPGFRVIPFGDATALAAAINDSTAAFLVEPIQGEAGVIVPPDGYLRAARELCTQRHVLFIADEIQTGLGRTGRTFACDWEDVTPDVYILGKALGGGVLPVSAVAANDDVLGVFDPGSHGSTFGGNPLACAVAAEAIDVLLEEQLASRSAQLGEYMLGELRRLRNPHIRHIRGRGLFIGVELDVPARPYCEQLMEAGVLCKETHEYVIRFAPPLVIRREELEDALARIRAVLDGNSD
ncbi:MAG: ornithine--oxo-acid transaminase [Alicyclobacillaceae bacterium]|nr:ornithine--oxo-acid transaminase [Alicyclobacillaceae bacterium]